MPFVVSVHIPKTAGTTVASVFDRCFSRRVVYDYDGYENPAEPNKLIRNNHDFVKRYFAVLHGHFFARKYFDVFDGAHFVTTVRHPVERVISQYQHEFNEDSSDAWYHEDIISGRMDVVDFADQPEVGGAMSEHLSGRNLKDYSLILISERLIESLALFSKTIVNLSLDRHYGSPVRLPTLNHHENRRAKRDFSDSERAEIYNKTARDNETYRISSELFGAKLKKNFG